MKKILLGFFFSILICSSILADTRLMISSANSGYSPVWDVHYNQFHNWACQGKITNGGTNASVCLMGSQDMTASSNFVSIACYTAGANDILAHTFTFGAYGQPANQVKTLINYTDGLLTIQCTGVR